MEEEILNDIKDIKNKIESKKLSYECILQNINDVEDIFKKKSRRNFLLIPAMISAIIKRILGDYSYDEDLNEICHRLINLNRDIWEFKTNILVNKK